MTLSQLPTLESEVLSALARFKKACCLVERTQKFAKEREANRILKDRLCFFEEGFKEHILKVTQTSDVAYLRGYIRSHKDSLELLQQKPGAHMGGGAEWKKTKLFRPYIFVF